MGGGTGSRALKWESLTLAVAWALQTKVQECGYSLGVWFPRGLVEEIGLVAAAKVIRSAEGGELVLRTSLPSRLRLVDLRAGDTTETIHACIDTGDAVGAEAF